ncbi:hypothetical protein BDW59DRAFT_115867 [Aspergillus cavernicola]|uniref:Uncharacterized protein n=1 Tax=Aspergillus cavernicola TaxID=176166 RepID=A0ABR4IX24_9EURO
MTNRRLLIFQESPLQSSHSHNPLSPTTPIQNQQQQQQQPLPYQTSPQFTYTPVNKLGLPVHGPGSLPDGLGLDSLLKLPLRVLNAFTEIFNAPKYKGWAIVAAGPYTDPTLGNGTGTFFAVVLEQVGASSSSSLQEVGMGS